MITDAPAARLAGTQEILCVTMLSLGFGLVGIDRFLITTMFPVIAKSLALSYSDIGIVTGALAIAWGISALFTGNLAEQIGRRRIIVASLIAFSLLIGASGLVTGILSLVAIRVIMGLIDGAYTPVSIVGTLAASAPTRRGLNIGIQQMMMPLFGLGFAPIFVAYALRVVEWRWLFLAFLVPGLALSSFASRVLPADDPRVDTPMRPRRSARVRTSQWREALAQRNVRIAAWLMLCWLTCLITTSAFMPNYLVDHLHIPIPQMAKIMSAIGLGATAGTLVLPWASDHIGRKAVLIVASIGALSSLVLLGQLDARPGALFGALFLVHFFNNALITLTVGPLCTEAVPPSLMATASGTVIAVGELFGGGLAPYLVGLLAQHAGIAQVLWLPIATVAIGLLLTLTIRTVRPHR